MPDKFDEMAREIEEDDGLAGSYVTRMCRAQPIGQPITEEQVSAWWEEGRRASRRARIAAALRSTDAKAREEERERCLLIALNRDMGDPQDIRDPYDKGYTRCARLIAEDIEASAIREGADACGTDTACEMCGGSAKVSPRHPKPDTPCSACQGGDDA